MAHNIAYWFLLLYVLLTCAITASSDDLEVKVLLKFKGLLSNATALDDWNKTDILCNGDVSNWKGLVCYNGQFTGLKLEAMGLGGTMDLDTLAQLPMLLTLSVMNNNFAGPFPGDLKKLGRLRGLYLANNRFSGEIPDDVFSGMKSLRRVVIGNNEFTSKIPMSLLELPKLVELQLQNNQFEGRIPDFWQENLTVNFANNKLDGPIPTTLRSQDKRSFSGNNLCGEPLDRCTKNSIPKVALVVAIAVAVPLAAIIAAAFIFCRRAKPQEQEKSVEIYKKKESNNSKGENSKNIEQGDLNFVRIDREIFELEELLRASAEVLGSGSFGSSYKAVLFSGQSFVVKRFRQMSSVRKEEFYQHMRRLGRLSHPNLLPLVAFYYTKEDKLLISDFAEHGSLASHLHSKQSPQQLGLDWPTRLKIIKGVAKGLAYLYEELPTLTLPHGHLKSSNVLLNNTYEPLLADYALAPVINKDHAQQFMVAYKSPESTQNDSLTRKTDVWNLGILILELLTGQFPANYLKQGRGGNADLAAWIKSVVREEWTGEVFDKKMNPTRNGESQMMRLLKIAMCCCEWDVEKRCDLEEAVEKIEELKERDWDDDFSSYASEGDMYSSTAITNES
ncbi:putative LRR receptor-like serine/threonine-protein kinase [Abeliophyllum distichum]|uniref:LRR receptor-like serine/threonine-protein kinase n=1 Tax=Abeliophyllum distichum TaxID=126358 RepID=A0ABD1NVI9_9LAMI